MSSKKILVTGATGYVGNRLVGALLERGFQVRASSRSLDSLKKRIWSAHPNIELVAMDALDAHSVEQACNGCTDAYYMIHSMNAGQKDFAQADRTAAQNMVSASRTVGLKRVIYLGGLGDENIDLSRHLQSRAEVGRILQEGIDGCTTLRAAMVIGTGSVSFEILSYLVRRLPLMVTPRWVHTESQPIAIRNVLDYLIGALENDAMAGDVYDIGGPQVLTYRNLMDMFAEEAHYRMRFIVPVPVLTPNLSSYWIQLVTPIHSSIARPLVKGLKNRMVCEDFRIRDLIPQSLLNCREAIRAAVNSPCDWSDTGTFPPCEAKYPGDPAWVGGGRCKVSC